MLIQGTKKLLDELKVAPTAVPYLEPLFAWHGHLITLNRRKAVILVNDLTRQTVLLFGLKKKDFQNLDQRIVEAV